MKKCQTKQPDWSDLIPILPGTGPRRQALHAELRRLIESGHILPGTRLPPSRALSARLGIARGAVVAAFEQLVADGFAEARVGAGTFVAASVPRVAPTAHAPAPANHVVAAPVLPGRLGSAMADTRMLDVFRKLLARHLTRPDTSHFHYADPRGDARLREEIARYLRTARAVRVQADQVVITSGTQQALDLFARAALQPGDAVWIEDPAYSMAAEALRGAQLRLVPVAVDDEGLDATAGRAHAPDARAVYVTPSNQFPLGVTLSMRRRLALLEWAATTGAWIIEDDYDSEFRYAGPPLASLQGMDGSGRVIYLGTFSKVLFPGLRTGYAVVPEPLLERFLAVRARSDRYPCSLAASALAALLHEGHLATHLRRARKRALQSRDALAAGLADSPLDVRVPDQGLHLVASLPPWLDERTAQSCALGAGLATRALSSFHLGNTTRQGLVIGFSGFTPLAFGAAARAATQALRTLAPH